VSGSNLAAEAEVQAATGLQRNGVNTALMRDVAQDSHLVGKSNNETSAVQDEVERVHGSGGYSQAAGEPAVPLSDNQQYSFRYDS